MTIEPMSPGVAASTTRPTTCCESSGPLSSRARSFPCRFVKCTSFTGYTPHHKTSVGYWRPRVPLTASVRWRLSCETDPIC